MNKQIERKSGQDRIAENVIYKRELNHSYMVLPCQDKDMAERYDYRIMQHNRIGGLLPCSLRYLDGEELLYYDITSRQPLARLYESRRMKASDLERIIRDTAAVQAQLGEYMLDESGVLLEEEVILRMWRQKSFILLFIQADYRLENSIRSWRISFWSISIMDRSRQ